LETDPKTNAFLRFTQDRRTRYAFAWVVAVTAAAVTLYVSRISFNQRERPDGNNGHTMIDFGGQWLMGRMLVLGRGRELYHRDVQRAVLTEAYPREDEVPEADRQPEDRGKHDVDDLMTWLMGDDKGKISALASYLAPLAASTSVEVATLEYAGGKERPERHAEVQAVSIGGPLYPPIHTLVMYPFGWLRPRVAYRAAQVLAIVLAFIAGWGVRVLSHGRVWWPVAAAAIVLYPGFYTSESLGQNSALVLTLLLWGWVAMAGGRPVVGGMLWGLLAFKPIWLTAFFLVPLLTRRWRVCGAVIATGTVLMMATLPLVGWHSWLDWLAVGKRASFCYNTDENWIFLSRDLVSIPRRWLLDFQVLAEQRTSLLATVLGWSLLLLVFGLTVTVAGLRSADRRQTLGIGPAFLFLGAWLCGFHFMYYDSLLTAVPACLLLLQPQRYFQRILIGVLPAGGPAGTALLADYYQPRLPAALPTTNPFRDTAFRKVAVLNSLTLSLIVLLWVVDVVFPGLDIAVSVSVAGLRSVPMPLRFSTWYIGTPWATFVILALWAWCGCQWIRGDTVDKEPATPRKTESSVGADVATTAAQLV
jgi:hypothetical protein